MNRKEFLKRLGMLTVGATLIGADVPALAAQAVQEGTTKGPKSPKTHPDLDFAVRPLKAQTNKVVTAIIIGAGSRGTTYGKYA